MERVELTEIRVWGVDAQRRQDLDIVTRQDNGNAALVIDDTESVYRMIVDDGIGVSYLSEDVVYKILLSLPVTSIRRFKCVCRGWYEIIKSPRFREEHFALQSKSALLLPYRREYLGPGSTFRLKILSGESLTVVKTMTALWDVGVICCSCRGLFLVYGEQWWECHLTSLWNPATGAFSRLPATPEILSPDGGISLNVEPHVYGLGWDPSTGGYKVVCLLYDRNVAPVYAPGKDDSWRLVHFPALKLPPETSLLMNPPLYVHTNGFCYWRSIRIGSESSGHCTIVSFDVAREVFTTFLLPPDVIRSIRRHTAISSYRDSLGVFGSVGRAPPGLGLGTATTAILD